MIRTILVALSIVSLSIQAFASAPVIYGTDNRKDLYDVLNPLYVKLADSTVALVKDYSLRQNSSGVVNIIADSFMNSMNMCSTERFADQPNGAFCSGSLIAPNIILTAGHCITDSTDCSETSFIFNYKVTQKGKYPTSVASNEVYHCNKIIHREQDAAGPDFGIILLDRAVTGHESLKLNLSRRNTTIENGTKIVMIGHPAGLPVKVDDDKSVRDASKNGYFVANTDSYGGNSGSAVFNQLNGEIEGVLVRGEQDYVRTATGCKISNVCPLNGCRGEDVTKISVVMPFIPAN